MKILFEKTPVKGIYVKYGHTHKNGKPLIHAMLTDEYRIPLDGCDAYHTVQEDESDEAAHIAARSEALKKFHQKFTAALAEQVDDCECFFSKCWFEIDSDKRIHLAPDTKENLKSKQTTLTYFENNTLKLLDKYGPFITQDECRLVSDTLYSSILMSKKFGHCLVSKDSALAVRSFIGAAKIFLTKNDDVKSNLGVHPKESQVESLMQRIQSSILGEDRLRSLLETTLKKGSNEAVMSQLWKKITADGSLIAKLQKLSREENLSEVANKIVFLLRELSGDENNTKAQANVHIRDANEILSNLGIASAKVLPKISLPLFVVDRVQQAEACKELPWKIRTRFCSIAMHICDDDPDALGGILMLTSGPRVAEVCAIQFGDILDYGDWGMCVINYTVDGDMRKEDGKNIYFHRPIFFPKFAMDAIHKRTNKLQKTGITGEQLKQVYIINKPDDLFSPANPHAFSKRIKQLLKLSGCTDDYWDSVHYAMQTQPDWDFFRRPELFDIAYGLRRDATTMLCNVARMTPGKVDALLGHRLPAHAKNWNDIITREKEWNIIINEMERIVYDPEHSNHPLFATRDAVKMLTDTNQCSYHGFSISPNIPAEVTIVAQSVGNADIRYSIPSDAKHQASITSVINSARPHTWLGVLHSKDEYLLTKTRAIEDYSKEVKPE